MILHRRTMTSDGSVIEFARGVHAATRFAWSYTFTIPECPKTAIPTDVLTAAQVLWDYHDMHHSLRPTDVGIGLGSHDLGVATYAAELYQQGMFPLIVFTGANAPTTVQRFPRGQVVHYAEHAEQLGVPTGAIIVDPRQPTPTRTSSLAEQPLQTRASRPKRSP
jgi:hypothetical protein